MEFCQHCGMYMKPFIKKNLTATCEFCGEVIARAKKTEKGYRWEKEPAIKNPPKKKT